MALRARLLPGLCSAACTSSSTTTTTTSSLLASCATSPLHAPACPACPPSCSSRSALSTTAFPQQQHDGGDVADVAIVGGGMVGAAVAALLRSNPLTRSMRVVLLDQKAQALQWQPPAFPELRVSTVTPASIRTLQQAGAWAAVEPHSAAVTTMQVWDASGAGCIRWHASDAGASSMGAVAENSALQAALLGAAVAGGGEQGQGGLELLWPSAIEALHLPPYGNAAGGGARHAGGGSTGAGAGSGSGGEASGSGSGEGSEGGEGGGSGARAGPAPGELATIVLQGGRQLRARLVVAADGAASRVRELAGLRTAGWGYGQRAVVATVELEGGLTDTAWQRFLPTGPLALLPVRGGLANIVWSTTPEAARALEALGPADFAAAVNRGEPPGRLGAWLAALQAAPAALSRRAAAALHSSLPGPSQYQPPPRVRAWVGGPPRSFPLQLRHAGRYVRPRLALVGDAAHAVHPLAGQGVNLGFGDAEALAAAVAWGRRCGADPGDALVLQDQYERPRQAANMAMITALDGLARTFSLQAPPLAAARNLGLSMINAAGPLKSRIMQYAMGA